MGGIADDDPIVRMAAIRALDLSTPAARDACVSTIHDADPGVAAAAAARAIGRTEDARPTSRLQALLADPDDGVRRAAVEQLALAPADSAAVLAWELLADPDAEVRAAALERVVATAPERGLEAALAGLRDPDPVVRIAAGRALGSVGGRGVEHVLEALDDPRTVEAAIEAARRLELSGDDDRVRAFIRSVAERATRDHRLAVAIPSEDDAAVLQLAHVTAGDPVGEMSLIRHAPRIASLVADGAVRTIRLGHREFESMLRERPSVALALMRVLAERLAERER